MQPLSQRMMCFLAAGSIGLAVILCGITAASVGIAIAHSSPIGGQTDFTEVTVHSGLRTNGTTVTEIVPGGPAWTMGLRPGWVVDPVLAAEVDGPGSVAACGRPDMCFVYQDRLARAAIAGRWSFEIVAATLTALAAFAWRRRPRMAGLLAMGAIATAAPTYALLGLIPIFPGLYLSSLVAPAVWVWFTGDRRRWALPLLATLLLSVAWSVAWMAMPDKYEVVENLRVLVIVGMVTIGAAAASGWIRVGDLQEMPDRTVDFAVAVAVTGAAAAAWWFGIVPAWLGAIMAGVAITGYLAFRHRVRGLVARLGFVELRQQATLRALEAERSRVARDLHDVPLQQLTAVIHNLDRRPGVATEATQLRRIAGYLRDVSVSLRPPILDDVGLGAALGELAGRFTEDGPTIRIGVDDQTGVEVDSRPPADVELTVYRVVQEAVANAERHARASLITVDGLIRPDRVFMTITDDGLGLSPRAAEQAQRTGRIGLASMRERADGIGATLHISRGQGGFGTAVSIEWSEK